MRTRAISSILTLAATLALAAPAARAVKVADITRLGGERTSVLTGLGLVYGLKGTGDGGDFTPAINPLRQMLAKFSDPVTVKELANAQNVAVVVVTATVPASGVRDGDHLDVHLTSVGAATSLRGGRLFVTPMQGPTPGGPFYAFAEGPVELADPATPTTAVVKAAAGGAVMEVDLEPRVVDHDRFSLILDDPSASWATAGTIAKIINDAEGTDGLTLAVAADSKNIVVAVPPAERTHPENFIGRVQGLPVQLLPTEAHVTIDAATGTIVMTGDVEISPVVISHNGLSISTVTPAPVGTAFAPLTSSKSTVAVGTRGDADAPTASGNLQDLVAAMEQLKVPTVDRIEIIKELYKTGKLHAKLIEE